MPTRKKTKDVAAYLAELQTTNIKGSVDDILLTCKVVRSAKECLSEVDFRDLRDHCVAEDLYSSKIWSKLLQIVMTVSRNPGKGQEGGGPTCLPRPPSDPLPRR